MRGVLRDISNTGARALAGLKVCSQPWFGPSPRAKEGILQNNVVRSEGHGYGLRGLRCIARVSAVCDRICGFWSWVGRGNRPGCDGLQARARQTQAQRIRKVVLWPKQGKNWLASNAR